MLSNYINVKFSLQDWNFPFSLYSFSVSMTLPPHRHMEIILVSIRSLTFLVSSGSIWITALSCLTSSSKDDLHLYS